MSVHECMVYDIWYMDMNMIPAASTASSCTSLVMVTENKLVPDALPALMPQLPMKRAPKDPVEAPIDPMASRRRTAGSPLW
jgi:hypothetical protein